MRVPGRLRALGSLGGVLGLVVVNCAALTAPGTLDGRSLDTAVPLTGDRASVARVAALPGLSDPTLLLPDRGPTGVGDPAPAVRFPPVAVERPRIRVDGIEPGRSNVVADALDTEGVSFATEMVVGAIAVRDGEGAATTLSVAAIDPVGFRVLAPQVTADAPAVWERLTEGNAAVGHQVGERLGLEVGALASAGGGAQLRIGAYAANGLPPVADALVTGETASRLQLRGVRTLLVSLEAGAEARAVARALEERVGGVAAVLQPPAAPGAGASGHLPADAASLGITPANVWDWLAQCESSGRWHLDSGNGYFGGLQFHPDSWYFAGGSGLAHLASREEQIARAEILLAYQGWEAWPACSKWLGLR